MQKALLLLCAAAFISSCGVGDRSTKVQGPTFVGYDYSPAILEGNWSGTLTAPSSFRTVRLEVLDGGEAEGVDSRGRHVDHGSFDLKNSDTGEMQATIQFEDGFVVVLGGFIRPGAERIAGNFVATGSVSGQFELKRYAHASSFADTAWGRGYSIQCVEEETDDERIGSVAIGNDGAILSGGEFDGTSISGGSFQKITGAEGTFAISLKTSSGETVFASALLSLADGRLAGEYVIAFPPSEGNFALEPEGQ